MAHGYFIYRIENERVVIYTLRRPDDPFAVPVHWPAMGNAAVAPEKGPVPEAQGSQPRAEGLGKLYVTPLAASKKEKPKCKLILKIVYLVLAVTNIMKSVALIAVAVTTAIAIKIFTDEQSGRRVAMIIVAITAAITLSIAIYAIFAVLTKKYKRLMIASVVLLTLAVVQAVLMGISIELTDEDELKLSRALSDSFRLAREDSPRHVKLWTNIQHDLNCCGVYGPEDYHNSNVPEFFAPDVPVSCCPGYDPDRSALVQERERQSCKAKKEYYDTGCRDPIKEMYRDTAKTVLGVTIGLMIFMVAAALLGAYISRKCRQAETSNTETETPKTKQKTIVKLPKV